MSPNAIAKQLWVILGENPQSRSGGLNHSHSFIHLKVFTWTLWGITDILWYLHSDGTQQGAGTMQCTTRKGQCSREGG